MIRAFRAFLAVSSLAASLLALPLHAAKKPAPLAKVNGVPILRGEVAERAFRQYGTPVINEMVDEILIAQAAKELGVQADPREVESRLGRIRSQFPSEAVFAERLAATGTNPEELKSRIEQQVLREALTVKAKDIRVGASEAQEFFEANKDKLGRPESVRLRHIVVASEKEAGDFLVALRAGADFATLAAGVSLDLATKQAGGDLGFFGRGMLQPEIEKLAFSLKPGEVSAPVRTPAGFHLFKAQETLEAKAAVFSEIASDLERSLLADKISKAWPPYLQELRDKAKIELSPTGR